MTIDAFADAGGITGRRAAKCVDTLVTADPWFLTVAPEDAKAQFARRAVTAHSRICFYLNDETEVELFLPKRWTPRRGGTLNVHQFTEALKSCRTAAAQTIW